MIDRLLVVGCLFCYAAPADIRGENPAPADKYQVVVKTILDEENVKVTQITVTTSLSARVGWSSVRPNRGGGWTKVTPRAGMKAETTLTVLVDHIPQKNADDHLKWLVKFGHAGGSTVTSSSGKVSGGVNVRKVLQMQLKTGDYPFEKPVDLFELDGNRYRLTVTKEPK